MKRTFKRTAMGAAAALMLVAPIAAMPSYANAAPAVQQSVQHDRWDRNSRYDRDHRDNRRGSESRYDRRDDRRHDRWEDRQWRRGDRLPAGYRSHYREIDYRHYGYRAPPRGYHYVRDNRGDALLVGIATGAVLGVILSSH